MMSIAEAIQFVAGVPDASLLYQASYQPSLIGASFLVAIFGAFAALRITSRVHESSQRSQKLLWIILGGTTLGGGIWSMHFIGMLALSLPCIVSYDLSLTLLSMIPGILASIAAFYVISLSQANRMSLITGSLLLGGGIGLMHYSGMVAMRIEGYIRYDPILFGLSLAIAVALAYIALRVKHRQGLFYDLLGALIMGSAISGMHYTAMGAAYFMVGEISLPNTAPLNQTYLAFAILIATLMGTLLSLLAASAYRHYETARREEMWRLALEGAGEGVWDWNIAQNTVMYSSSWKQMLGYQDNEISNSFDEWEKRVHPEDLKKALTDVADYLADRKNTFFNEHRLRCKDGSWRWILTRGSITNRDKQGRPLRMVGTHADISKRKRAENLEHARNELLEVLTKGATLHDLLESALVIVENYHPDMRCVIMLLDEDGEHMHVGAAPSMPGFFVDGLQGIPVGQQHACCCQSVASAQRVVTEDLQNHVYSESFKALSTHAGFHGCWSEPIRSSSGKILGTFDIYLKNKGFPDTEDILLIEQTSRLLGVGIDQSIADAELQLASLVYQNSGEAMMVTDAGGLIIGINPAFTNLTGYSLNEALGKDHTILNSNYHDEAFYQDIRQSVNSAGHWQGEVWNQRKNGEIFAEWLTINTIFNEDGEPHRRVALFSDITERKNSEELIWQQANFDSLTGLPNRRMFQERLHQEIKKSSRSGLPLALLFLDIDHFKEINDALGHDVGDMLLKQAAHRLSVSVRGTDTVARLGGDEFTIILSELDDIENVERVIDDIMSRMKQPFDIGTQVLFASVSIGVTFYPEDAPTGDILIKNADQAMYAAKSQGRQCHVYFTSAMQEAVQARLRMTSQLRMALSKSQFRVYYQPIVNFVTGNIEKAEALIRWQHPQLGRVSPAEFIPIAEDTGLITEIGDWVFREAVTKVTEWRERYLEHFQVSVNKSPIQLRNEKAEHLRWAQYLMDSGLSGQSIVVEITESLLLDSSTTISNRLLEFRDAGMQVAIDDFGTGYSSLSYLKKFDIDYLKIDQSFVANLTPGSNDMALCEAMIVMAHKLGMKVVAEGIENEAQYAILRKIGCDFGQGFLISKPLPTDDFEKLLREHDIHQHHSKAALVRNL